MPRPVCCEHPNGRVRRDGYYGSHKEFIRWECLPGDGSKPHYLRQDQLQVGLHAKLTGGPQGGACDECERVWQETDGMPSADYDKFVLREKVRTLVRLAEGRSYRNAAYGARMRVRAQRGDDFEPGSISRDGRMTGDWVPQYTDIIADLLLPKAWPRMLAVDGFDVRIRALRPDGRPLQKGRHLYSVLGAAGYETFGKPGQLWHLQAFTHAREREFREFFHDLEGARNVRVVLCDGSRAIRNAAEWAFPHARIYPCSWHLMNILADHERLARLNTGKRAIWRALRTDDKDLFWHRRNWTEFELLLGRYLAAVDEPADPCVVKGLRDMDTWRRRNRELVDLVLDRPHGPRDLTLLEEHLATVRDTLGERRRMFRNLPRLNSLLKLILLDLRGDADEARWARILRANHIHHHGQPPQRRLVDGQLINVA